MATASDWTWDHDRWIYTIGIIGLFEYGYKMYAVCADGTIWRNPDPSSRDSKWEQYHGEV